MNKIFSRILKSRIHGDEEKENWLWDLFYNYEVLIGGAVSAILCLIVAIIIFPFLYFSFETESFTYDIIFVLFGIGAAIIVGDLVASFIVSPLKESDGEKRVRKENVKQGSLFLATALGHIANFFINWGPLLILAMNFIRFNWGVFIGMLISTVLYYIVLGWVKPNAKDYVNWRFNWAIENYDLLFSKHYKWWTSAAAMSVQKYNLKKFQKYKYHATLAVIMIPLMMTPAIQLGLMSKQKPINKTERIQEATDSISTPDVVENNAISESEDVIENQDNEQSAITPDNDESYEEEPTSIDSENSIQTVVVTGVNVRLRTSPEINDYNIIKDSSGKNLHPNKGEQLQCIGEDGDFYLVNYRGNNVYISKQFAVIQ